MGIALYTPHIGHVGGRLSIYFFLSSLSLYPRSPRRVVAESRWSPRGVAVESARSPRGHTYTGPIPGVSFARCVTFSLGQNPAVPLPPPAETGHPIVVLDQPSGLLEMVEEVARS